MRKTTRREAQVEVAAFLEEVDTHRHPLRRGHIHKWELQRETRIRCHMDVVQRTLLSMDSTILDSNNPADQVNTVEDNRKGQTILTALKDPIVVRLRAFHGQEMIAWRYPSSLSVKSIQNLSNWRSRFS
jgi:hypothetical protein